MSRFDELDAYFDALKQVARPEVQKQKTLVNVLKAKKKIHKIHRPLAGGIAIFSVIIAIFLLITTENGQEDLTATSIEVEVGEVWVANSVSSTSFKAYSTSTLKAAQIKDELFFQELESFLSQLTPLEAIPTYQEPSFDMTIKATDGDQLHVKLWENKGEIILYSLTDEKYYTSEDKSAMNIYRMLNNITLPK